jgi:hypothetical protein
VADGVLSKSGFFRFSFFPPKVLPPHLFSLKISIADPPLRLWWPFPPFFGPPAIEALTITAVRYIAKKVAFFAN